MSKLQQTRGWELGSSKANNTLHDAKRSRGLAKHKSVSQHYSHGKCSFRPRPCELSSNFYLVHSEDLGFVPAFGGNSVIPPSQTDPLPSPIADFSDSLLKGTCGKPRARPSRASSCRSPPNRLRGRRRKRKPVEKAGPSESRALSHLENIPHILL